MQIEAARRAEAAAKDMLASANDGSASSSELRRALEMSKAFMAVTSAFQASAAATIAKRERHGDGGAQVLADTAGLSRRDAQGQVKTAKDIKAVPAVQEAVQDGRMSFANARRLVEAAETTSANDVESDRDLLAKAESMRPEHFAKEARRWAAKRQADGGEADHARCRARRCLSVWDGDDGMVNLHGKFDPATGRRIANRLQAEARRLHDTDKKSNNNAHDGADDRRSFQQCMADALDNLTSNTTEGAGKPFADIAVVAHVDDETGRLVAEIAGGDPLPPAVLEELMCNAAVTGVLYDTKGVPLWRGHTKRTATAGQRKPLIARYGGCFHCGAHPAMCQAHHIRPWSRGGRTDINNMVLICWSCHQKIHHHGWQIHTHSGQHTLHPPDPTHYGPARAPDPLPHFDHSSGRAPRSPREPSRAQQSAVHNGSRAGPTGDAAYGTLWRSR